MYHYWAWLPMLLLTQSSPLQFIWLPLYVISLWSLITDALSHLPSPPHLQFIWLFRSFGTWGLETSHKWAVPCNICLPLSKSNFVNYLFNWTSSLCYVRLPASRACIYDLASECKRNVVPLGTGLIRIRSGTQSPIGQFAFVENKCYVFFWFYSIYFFLLKKQQLHQNNIWNVMSNWGNLHTRKERFLQ